MRCLIRAAARVAMTDRSARRLPRLLVVDDEVDLLASYEIILAAEGFEVCTASNGKAALEKVGAFQPDLIVTDWMMPLMDGIELITRLRGQPATGHIPIIMTSAAGDWGRHGCTLANEFLRKPVMIADLLRAIGRWLKA